MKRIITLLIGCCLLLLAASTCFAQTIITFDAPNSTHTHPTAINLGGQITGYYYDNSGYPHGFMRRHNGEFISFDFPQPPGGFPPSALPMDINAAGEITGLYRFEMQLHSFLRKRNGTLIEIRQPLVSSNPSNRAPFMYVTDFTDYLDRPLCGGEDWWLALAINDLGQITGSGPVLGPRGTGFLRNPDGSYVNFDVEPGFPDASTCPQAINLFGQITGFYAALNDGFRGFFRQYDGSVVRFEAPDSVQTIPMAINLFAQITGFYQDNFNFRVHGFLRQPNGDIKAFDPSDSTSTEPTAINALGEITGSYLGSDGIAHGFVRKPNGTIITFDAPNSQGTWPRSINLFGTIAGYYFDGSTYHGFVKN